MLRVQKAISKQEAYVFDRRDLGLSRYLSILDGYCSTVQGLLDWFEVDLGFTKLLFIQTDLSVL